MSEIERMKRYIKKTKLTPEVINRYCLDWCKMTALCNETEISPGNAFNALLVAFDYGLAKGYRAAKAEGRAKE